MYLLFVFSLVLAGCSDAGLAMPLSDVPTEAELGPSLLESAADLSAWLSADRSRRESELPQPKNYTNVRNSYFSKAGALKGGFIQAFDCEAPEVSTHKIALDQVKECPDLGSQTQTQVYYIPYVTSKS